MACSSLPSRGSVFCHSPSALGQWLLFLSPPFALSGRVGTENRGIDRLTNRKAGTGLMDHSHESIQWFSKCGLQTNSISNTQEPVRNADLRPAESAILVEVLGSLFNNLIK